jgi:hypothetical protein
MVTPLAHVGANEFVRVQGKLTSEDGFFRLGQDLGDVRIVFYKDETFTGTEVSVALGGRRAEANFGHIS